MSTGKNYKSIVQNPAERHKITNISISYESVFKKIRNFIF